MYLFISRLNYIFVYYLQSIDDSEFESVAVIRTTQPAGIHNLRNKKFCHPGLYYDRNERWTERFLKHFERTVIVPQCSNETASAAEIETESFANFFSQACRPGSWSNDPAEDKRLSNINTNISFFILAK